MNTSLTILVWIISVMLGIFLLLAIAALIMVLKLMKELKRIAEKAEKLADSAEAVGDFFRKSAGPMALGKFLTNIADAVIKHKQGRKRGDDDE
jgi:hypothetical protein